MKFNVFRVAAFGALLLAPLSAQAQVDQSFGAYNYQYASSDPFGQSFKPTQNNVRGIGALLYNNTGSSRTFSLMGGVGDSATLAPLAGASGSATFTIAANDSGWFNIFFAPVALDTSRTYLVLFQSDDENVMYVDNYDPTFATGYARGTAFNPDPDTTLPVYYSEDDYGFQEFYAEGFSEAPEPASFVLLGTGLLGIFGVSRRRRKM